MANAIALVVLLLISPAAYAVEHAVGDTGNWVSGTNYTAWASKLNFTVGDTLVFTYNSAAHTVVEVDEPSYQSCSTAKPIASYSTGPTTIPLNTTGIRYFVCSIHCLTGNQKVAVTTVAATGATSPPAAGTTPSGTPPSHTPPPPSAAITSAGEDSLIVGLMSLVLMGLIMG